MAETPGSLHEIQDGSSALLPAVEDISPGETGSAYDTPDYLQEGGELEEIANAVLGQLETKENSCQSLPVTETPDAVDAQDLSQDKMSSCCPTDRHKMPNEKWRGENYKEKSKEEPGKSKDKKDLSIEHILKALSSLHTTEEKLAALCKKYADLMEEHRSLQNSYKHSERRNVHMQKEKEQLQTEHSKAILTRSRLESLCRELQRQNRTVKDESLMRVREEEEKRKEVSAKFQTTFNEITNMMQDNNQKSSKLREENVELATKLKSLIEQYESREQQVDKIVKHKDLEVQLAEAKLAKAVMEFTEEREKFLTEKHKCLQDLAEYQKKCQELTQNEIRLRTQLNLYTDKYEEFQQTLSKSNEVFTHFKEEMDKMSKKIKKLEKETGSWRSRWENSNKALLEMATEKQHRDTEYLAAQKKILQLEKLCRALQTERQSLLEQIKGNLSLAAECPLTEATECKEIDVNVDAQAQVPEENDLCELGNVISRISSESVLIHPVEPQVSSIPEACGLPDTAKLDEGAVIEVIDNHTKGNNSQSQDSNKQAACLNFDDLGHASNFLDVETTEPRVQCKTKERNKKKNKGKQTS